MNSQQQTSASSPPSAAPQHTINKPNSSSTSTSSPHKTPNHLSMISLSKLKNYMPQNSMATKLIARQNSSHSQVPFYAANLDAHSLAARSTYNTNLERLARIKAHRLSQHSISFDSSIAAANHYSANIDAVKFTQANLQSSANQVPPLAQQELTAFNTPKATLSQTAASPSTNSRQLQGCNSSLLLSSHNLPAKGVELAKPADRQHHRPSLTGSDERKRKKIDSTDIGASAANSSGKPDTCDKTLTKPNESRSIFTEKDNNMIPSSMLLLQNHNYIEGQAHRSATTYNELNHTSQESTASSNTSTNPSRTIVLGCGPSSSSSNDHSDSNISLQHCHQPNQSPHKSSSLTMPNINDNGCYDSYCYCYNYSQQQQQQQPAAAPPNHQYHLATSAGASLEPAYPQQSHPLHHAHLSMQQQQTQPLHTQHQQQAHSPHNIVTNQHSSYHQLANKAASVNHMYGTPVPASASATSYPTHLHNSIENHESNHHLIAEAHQNHLDTAAAACAAAAVVSQTLKTVANHHSQQTTHYASNTNNSFASPNTGSLMNMSAPHHQQFHSVNPMNHNHHHHHLMNQAPITNSQSSNIQVHHQTSIVTRKYQCKMCPQIFMSKAEMKYHNQNHMREAKPYKCLQCPKAFANSSYLSQHMRIHQGVKPYTCDICARKFTQLSHLQQHKRTHTGDKPYKCNYMNCTKQFSQLSNLQSHSRCHQLDKPYKCNSCYKCFHDEQSLLEHIPRHLESKHLKKNLCIFCGSSYQQERGLVKHFQQYHTDKTPTLVAAAIAAGTTGNTNLIASLVSTHTSSSLLDGS